MTKLRLLFAACVLVAVATAGSTAFAAPSGAATCSGGPIASGTYSKLTVTGNCTFTPGALTVRGNLTVAPGAILNDHVASSGGVTVHVGGNVLVGEGAVLGLGDYSRALPHESAVVDGNVIANEPQTLYLGGMTIHGNLISNGGSGPDRNFPIKDDTIDGNVILQGWSGLWFGLIRSSVGGNVVISHMAGTQTGLPGTEFEGILDSTEVVSNTIGGNLICLANIPAAQVGDAAEEGGGPNTVGGHKLGECAKV
jgi:hypothetical protein